ncbi:MAG: hypothetical protein J2P18_09220 [Nocardia sp.]|nr:hypothetical protein [Nocardia sp.]
MSPAALGGVVFDTAAVVGWARRLPYVHAVAWATATAGHTIVVPAAVAAAGQALVPASRLDILGVLLDLPHTVIPALDIATVSKVGRLLTGRSDADALVAAGHAASEAVARNWPCLTARPDMLRRIDRKVLVDPLP